ATYVVTSKVNGPQRGATGDPTLWSYEGPANDLLQPQDLGVLFPHELQSGVDVTRAFSLFPATNPSGLGDAYRFGVLQSREYIFLLNGSNLPAGMSLTLFDSGGAPVPTAPQGTGLGVRAVLNAGTYVV